LEIFCGIDWSERHHDVAVVDQAGALLARRRISDDLAGFTELTGLLAELAGDAVGTGTPVRVVPYRGARTWCGRAARGPAATRSGPPRLPKPRPDRRRRQSDPTSDADGYRATADNYDATAHSSGLRTANCSMMPNPYRSWRSTLRPRACTSRIGRRR